MNNESTLSSKWVGLARPAPNPHGLLIGFPYAGAGAGAYRRWCNDLAHHNWLSFVSVQLPGRESRRFERPLANLAEVVDAATDALGPLLTVPYALVGYSMGAVLAFELARRFERSARAPALLIVAAREPPAATVSGRRKEMTRDQLIEKMHLLGGTPAAVLQDQQLLELFLRILDTDIRAVDSHTVESGAVVSCPILALGGADDPDVSIPELHGWQQRTSKQCVVRLFPGGHFFLHTAHDAVMSVINAALARLDPATSDPHRIVTGAREGRTC